MLRGDTDNTIPKQGHICNKTAGMQCKSKPALPRKDTRGNAGEKVQGLNL